MPEYRLGRHNRTIFYYQAGDEPSDNDEMVAVVTKDRPTAEEIKNLLNLGLTTYALSKIEEKEQRQ